MPMKKLKPAMSITRETILSCIGKVSCEATSPARRPPPTTLTGPLGSRCSRPTIACATSHTLAGSWARACKVSTAMRPICWSV